MAQNELALQNELVHRVNEQGGHAFKLASPLFAGRCDLYIRIHNQPRSLFVEVKWWKTPLAMGSSRQTGLTPLQKHFLKRESDAGGMVAMIIGFNSGGATQILTSWDVQSPSITRVEGNGIYRTENSACGLFVRPRGKEWNTYTIFEPLMGGL